MASGEYERGCAAGRAWRAHNPGVLYIPTGMGGADYSRGFNECASPRTEAALARYNDPPAPSTRYAPGVDPPKTGAEPNVSGFDLAFRG